MEDQIDVKALRESLGWTQGQLAEYLGLDRSGVSRMETRQAPSGPVRRLLKELQRRADEGTAHALLQGAAA